MLGCCRTSVHGPVKRVRGNAVACLRTTTYVDNAKDRLSWNVTLRCCVPNSDTRRTERESYNRLYTRLRETHYCSALCTSSAWPVDAITRHSYARETRLRGYGIRTPGQVTPGCTLRVSTRLRMFYEIHDGGPLEGGGGDVMGLLNKLEGYGGVGVSVPLQTGE